MSRQARAAEIRSIMETEGQAVSNRLRTVNQGTEGALQTFESYEQLRSEARDIKESAIEQLPDLIDQVIDAVETNGGTVYLAQDANDANRYIESVMESADAQSLVKSKSMTTEEIELNSHLEAAGYEVTETDLGEYVIQLADESPSHLIGPAMHKSTESIAELFNKKFTPDEPFPADPEVLTEFAKTQVGEQIETADVGLTGANFIIAESGSICLVTNEGNARKSAVTPPIHVAVGGVEKLIPTLADLQPFVELIAKAGTGQNISAYVSLLTPPVDTPTIDFEGNSLGDASEREFHLVLLDNGRMAMREDEDLRETLYCIRCGACANTCPNFQSVGGHIFGGETYTGGIGTGWEAGVYGNESATGMSDMCTGCTQCVPKCPVKIDIPWINTIVRDRINREASHSSFDFLVEGLLPDEEPAGIDIQKRLFGNIESVAKIGSKTPRLSNFLSSRHTVRQILESVVGVDQRRDLPAFAQETFREWFADRGSRILAQDADQIVVLYPDVYTDYFAPERGQAAVRILESMNIAVRVPDVGESGRAPLSQGMIETAKEQAAKVYKNLAIHIDSNHDIVVIEPSDLAMFRTDYAKLLPEPSAARIRDNSYEIFEYLNKNLPEEFDEIAALSAEDRSIAYHSHCQQRTLGLEQATVDVLESFGYEVTTTNVECCGMAGSFGYKTEYYEMSMDVGNWLHENLPDGRLVASGTSCKDQIEALTAIQPVHPIELLDPKYV